MARRGLLGSMVDLGTRNSARQRDRAVAKGRPRDAATAMQGYVTARQLRYRGDLDQPGFLAALPVEVAQRFNVLRGALPGGEDGVPGLDVPADEQVRAWIGGVARQRGLVAEDALAFHRAFPRVTRAGQAFAVFRGQLPGTGVSGRLVAYAERQIQLPHSGVNAALVPVRAGTADAPTQTLAEGLAAGVRGGVLNVSRLRVEPGLGGGELDRLATEAVEIAGSWGVLDHAYPHPDTHQGDTQS